VRTARTKWTGGYARRVEQQESTEGQITTLEGTEAPRKKKISNGWRSLIAVVVVAIVLSVANYNIHLPYFVLSPGDALPVKSYVQISPDHLQAQSGKILLATVAVTQATPIEWALAHVMPGDDIERKAEILGPQTTQTQYIQENQEAMDDSQMTAITVAMKRAGYTVTQLGDGAAVAEVATNAPATGKLNAGDVITGIDGKSVSTADQFVADVDTLHVGDVAHLQVRNQQKQTRAVDVTLGKRPDNGDAYVGIALTTDGAHLQTPFPVSFKQTDIGGPSAGLAFTLTLLDELTPGQLTGGKTVATTGTINPDGTVGEVGGVKQKTRAVEAAGAKVFLVPTAEYSDAKKEAGKGLTVIPVNNLNDAINALAAHGGDASGIPAQK
jgi:Lon-like protease